MHAVITGEQTQIVRGLKSECGCAWWRQAELLGGCYCHAVRRSVYICVVSRRHRCTLCLCLHVHTCTGQGCVGVCGMAKFEIEWLRCSTDSSPTLSQPAFASPRTVRNGFKPPFHSRAMWCLPRQSQSHMYGTCSALLTRLILQPNWKIPLLQQKCKRNNRYVVLLGIDSDSDRCMS